MRDRKSSQSQNLTVAIEYIIALLAGVATRADAGDAPRQGVCKAGTAQILFIVIRNKELVQIGIHVTIMEMILIFVDFAFLRHLEYVHVALGDHIHAQLLSLSLQMMNLGAKWSSVSVSRQCHLLNTSTLYASGG